MISLFIGMGRRREFRTIGKDTRKGNRHQKKGEEIGKG